MRIKTKGLTTPIPSKANMAVPKKRGYFFQPTTGGSFRGSDISCKKNKASAIPNVLKASHRRVKLITPCLQSSRVLLFL